MQLNEEYRSEVKRAMVYAMISGLENGQLKADQLPEIAARILDGLPKAMTHQDLVAYLEAMGQQWRTFTTVANAEMARAIERSKEGVVQQMLTHARNGDIDSALKAGEILKAKQQ